MNQPMQLLTSHESIDWLTPPFYIDMVRKVLGKIDLDPAAHLISQRWIKAKVYWLPPINSLCNPWYGKVFANPPYGKNHLHESNQSLWSMKMHYEYQYLRMIEGILLINSTHGYSWYEDITRLYPICLVKERIRFLKPDPTSPADVSEGGQAKRGQTFLYMGPNVAKFREVFKEIGRIIYP